MKIKPTLIIVTAIILVIGTLLIINLSRGGGYKWFHGVAGKPGNGPGQLNIPDLPASTIGKITRHAQNFINQNIKVQGYLIKRETGYIIISDEASGAISRYDLPVIGPGIDTVQPDKKYIFQGTFLDQGRVFSNNNPDHLELSQPPESSAQ